MTEPTLRDRIRAIRVFPTDLPSFNTDAAPADPIALLTDWLVTAIDGGVAQPHAMVLATANASGVPSARTLLLKDVTAEGVWFASLSSGPKGHDLDENPQCALVLYWREQGRQVRITGSVKKGPRAVSEADFLARHPLARAAAIAGEQSRPEPSADQKRAAITAASAAIEANPDLVPDEWNAYVVEPDSVEFWQAGPDRTETRLSFTRVENAWSSQLIWP